MKSVKSVVPKVVLVISIFTIFGMVQFEHKEELGKQT